MIAEKMKRYRREHGLKQEDLAGLLHVSRSAVSRWENGYGTPDLENLQALADLMGVRVDALLREREDEAPGKGRRGRKGRRRAAAAVAALLLLACLGAVLAVRSAGRLSRALPDFGEMRIAEYPYSGYSAVDGDRSEAGAFLNELGKAGYAGSGNACANGKVLFSVKLDARRYDILSLKDRWYVYDSGSNRAYSCGSGLISAADELAGTVDPDHVSYFLGPPEYSDNLDGRTCAVTLTVEEETGIRVLGYRISYGSRVRMGELAAGRVPAVGDGTLREGKTYRVCVLSAECFPELFGPRIDWLTFSFYDLTRPEETVGEVRIPMYEMEEAPLRFRCRASDAGPVVERDPGP